MCYQSLCRCFSLAHGDALSLTRDIPIVAQCTLSLRWLTHSEWAQHTLEMTSMAHIIPLIQTMSPSSNLKYEPGYFSVNSLPLSASWYNQISDETANTRYDKHRCTQMHIFWRLLYIRYQSNKIRPRVTTDWVSTSSVKKKKRKYPL